MESGLGHCAEQWSSLGDSQNHAPGNVGPNQAGADGNGADGQTFSPVRSPIACSYCWDNHQAAPSKWCADGLDCGGNPLFISRVDAGLSELRDAKAECFCGSVPGLRHLDDDGHLPHCPAKPIRDANAQRRDASGVAAPGVLLDWFDEGLEQ